MAEQYTKYINNAKKERPNSCKVKKCYNENCVNNFDGAYCKCKEIQLNEYGKCESYKRKQ